MIQLRNLYNQVHDYFEKRETERFSEFMEEVKQEAEYILSFNKPIREMHASSEAWRLVN